MNAYPPIPEPNGKEEHSAHEAGTLYQASPNRGVKDSVSNYKIAIVIVWLVGLQFMFGAITYLTYLPDRLFTANHARTEVGVQAMHLEMDRLILRAILRAYPNRTMERRLPACAP